MFEIIGTIFSIFLGIFITKLFIDDFWEHNKIISLMGGIAMFALGGGIGLLFMFAIGAGVQSVFLGTNTNQEYVSISSLKPNNNTEGSFFLGSGSIKDVEYYLFFQKLKNSRYIRGRVPAEGTIIEENNNENPRLEWTRHTGKTNKFITMEYIHKDKDYILYVPEGTIIKQFKLE